MSERHLRADSALPPLAAGRLRLYSMAYCPFAQRTRLVLAHKGIDYEVVNVHLRDKPSWFFERNPTGTVPILEQDGQVVYESAITMEYLDEVYPQKGIIPKDPLAKAEMKMLMERFNKINMPYFDILINHKNVDKSEEDAKCVLDVFEAAIQGKYFGGDEPYFLDYYMWPFFERLPYMKEVLHKDLLPEERFPKLSAWVDAMATSPAAKEASTPLKYFPQVNEAYIKKTMPPYDIALKA